MQPADVIIVGNYSDDPFAIDVAYSLGQREDIADLISMKTFANSEFCPRFISDERDFSRIGGSDPVMWSGVFDRNTPALLAALDDFEAHLAELRQAIEAGDTNRCRALIAAARARRAGEAES